MKNNSPVTGRIARLQRAGICVLIGYCFLPYKEYSIRNKAICAKEAELQSFEVLSIKRSNFNCVLSKDRVTINMIEIEYHSYHVACRSISTRS